MKGVFPCTYLNTSWPPMKVQKLVTRFLSMCLLVDLIMLHTITGLLVSRNGDPAYFMFWKLLKQLLCSYYVKRKAFVWNYKKSRWGKSASCIWFIKCTWRGHTELLFWSKKYLYSSGRCKYPGKPEDTEMSNFNSKRYDKPMWESPPRSLKQGLTIVHLSWLILPPFSEQLTYKMCFYNHIIYYKTEYLFH